MLEWLTALLALMTGFLAWETRGMARATKKLAALSAEPYLAFLKLKLNSRIFPASDSEPERRGYSVLVVLCNPGQVRIYYEVEDILVSVAGRDYPPSPDSFDGRGAIGGGNSEWPFRDRLHREAFGEPSVP